MKRRSIVRERVFHELDQEPTLTRSEVADRVGVSRSTIKPYYREWLESSPSAPSDAPRCPSCQFTFEQHNPPTREGVCLACYCIRHGIDQRAAFVESGLAVRLGLIRQPSPSRPSRRRRTF